MVLISFFLGICLSTSCELSEQLYDIFSFLSCWLFLFLISATSSSILSVLSVEGKNSSSDVSSSLSVHSSSLCRPRIANLYSLSESHPRYSYCTASSGLGVSVLLLSGIIELISWLVGFVGELQFSTVGWPSLVCLQFLLVGASHEATIACY